MPVAIRSLILINANIAPRKAVAEREFAFPRLVVLGLLTRESSVKNIRVLSETHHSHSPSDEIHVFLVFQRRRRE